MNQKKFEFHNKDIPLLKKDIRKRLLFVILFMAAFISQLIMIILNVSNGVATVSRFILASVVMIMSLLFAVLSVSFIMKANKQINTIKKSGYCVSYISVLPSIHKSGFAKTYSFITQVIAVLTLVLFCWLGTYAVLEFIYFTTVSQFFPLLLLLTVVGFNSSYHIKHELKITESVQVYS